MKLSPDWARVAKEERREWKDPRDDAGGDVGGVEGR